MIKNFKNHVNLKEGIFWKAFLRVLLLCYTLKLGYVLFVLLSHYKKIPLDFLFEKMIEVFFSLFPFLITASFITAYFLAWRLINENPKKVFTHELIIPGLFFIAFELFILLVGSLVGGELGAFIFPLFMQRFLYLPALATWLFLSTLWLYGYFKKSKI